MLSTGNISKFVAAAGAMALLAGCGSTSSAGSTTAVAGTGAAPAGKTAIPWGDQICSQSSGQQPGYPLPFQKISGGASSLSGAGSTFVAPVMSVWTKNYATTENVQVAYQSIGSGGGVQQFSAQTVDFGASDTPMKDSEIAAAKGGAVLHIPLVLGAVVPSYNLKSIGSGLKFDGPTLGRIFAGLITKWNDPALSALNPGVQLPDEPIAVAHRSDGSGTTAVWTDYLTKTSPDWVSKLGAGVSAGKEVAWPVGIGGKGNEGVSGVINQTEGTLGYVELAYAVAQNLPYGSVKNQAGKFVEPCVATTSKGVNGITFPADLRTSLTDGPDPDAYPITGTTYGLVYANQTDQAKGAAIVNFFSWVASTGQDQVAALSYAPLGSDLQKLVVGQIAKISYNGNPMGTPTDSSASGSQQAPATSAPSDSSATTSDSSSTATTAPSN